MNTWIWIQFIASVDYKPANIREQAELDRALSALKCAALTMGRAGLISARANLQVSPAIMRAIGG